MGETHLRVPHKDISCKKELVIFYKTLRKIRDIKFGKKNEALNVTKCT